MAGPYLDERLGDFLDLVADREPAPGGGAVAAVAASLAAGLVEMAARFSSRPGDPDTSIALGAEQLRRRAAALADTDAQAYRAVIEASRHRPDGDPAERRERTRAALQWAAEVPLEITEIGAETAGLAAAMVRHGNANLRGDAHTAVLLAQAAVRSAAELVRLNVESGGLDHGLLRRAAANVTVAAGAGGDPPDLSRL